MRSNLAFVFLLLACGSDTSESGDTSGAGAVREQPAPECHDVAASTRTPRMVIGSAPPATGGDLPVDGRYELDSMTGSQEVFAAAGPPSPQVFEVRGSKFFLVLGPPEQSATRGTLIVKTPGARSVVDGGSVPTLDFDTVCGSSGTVASPGAPGEPYSRTPTGFRLGEREFVKAR